MAPRHDEPRRQSTTRCLHVRLRFKRSQYDNMLVALERKAGLGTVGVESWLWTSLNTRLTATKNRDEHANVDV